MSASKAIQVSISGRVQGVGFRAWTKSQARKKSLNGWVRNRSDGTVEAVFSGKAEAVDDMLAACHDGPLASRVKDVSSQPYSGEIAEGFEHLPTE